MLFINKKYESLNRVLNSCINEEEEEPSIEYTLKADALKPQNLGLTSVTERNDVIAAIDRVGSDSLSDNVKALCKLLCNKVASNTKQTVDIENLTLSGMPHLDKSSVDVGEAPVLELLKISDIRNSVIKDFGEVLGAIFLLNYVDGAKEIVYNEGTSDKIVDYSIVIGEEEVAGDKPLSWGVSAKALRGGARPSVQGLIEAIDNSDKNELIDLINKSYNKQSAKETLKLLINTLSEKTETGEYTAIANQWVELIEKYLPRNSCISRFKDLFNISLSDAVADITKFGDIFDAVFNGATYNEDGTFKKYNKRRSKRASILDLAKDCCDKFNTKPKIIPSEFNKDIIDKDSELSAKNKLGVFVYPMERGVVSNLNTLLGINSTRKNSKKPDIFTAIVRHYFRDYRQLYLDLDLEAGSNSIIFTFKIKKMSQCDWKLVCTNSAKEPFAKRLGIQVIM